MKPLLGFWLSRIMVFFVLAGLIPVDVFGPVLNSARIYLLDSIYAFDFFSCKDCFFILLGEDVILTTRGCSAERVSMLIRSPWLIASYEKTVTFPSNRVVHIFSFS